MSKPVGAEVELVPVGPEAIDLVGDLADCGLRGDAFIPRGQLRGILGRASSRVLLIVVAGEVCGFAIMYHGVTLHNLFLLPHARGAGIGQRVVEALSPQIIRSKTNMKSGDPTPFYARLGYSTVGVDEKRPHIAVMSRRGDEPTQPPPLPPSAAAIPAHTPARNEIERENQVNELEYLREKERRRKEKQAERSRRRYHKNRQAEQTTSGCNLSTGEMNSSLPYDPPIRVDVDRASWSRGTNHVERNGT